MFARASGKGEDVAMTLNNLGNLHGSENRMADARAAFEKALKIYRTFAKVAPAAYEPDVRRVQTILDALLDAYKECFHRASYRLD